MYDTAIFLMIGDRFFSSIKNDRVMTAWSLSGAKLFLHDSKELFRIEKLLSEKGKTFERRVAGFVG